MLHRHPWTLKGGAALEILQIIQINTFLLSKLVAELGIVSVTGADNFFIINRKNDVFRIGNIKTKPLVTGNNVRNWSIIRSNPSIWPYLENSSVQSLTTATTLKKKNWCCRNILNKRKRFGTSMIKKGYSWYEWQEVYWNKLKTPLSITFAFVATHNHFVLDRGGKVFKQTAPVIKLPENATESDHLGLLGLLNSSVAAFWLRMFCQGKPLRGEEAFQGLEYDSTKLKHFPVPLDRPLLLATLLDQAASERAKYAPELHIDGPPKTLNERLDVAKKAQAKLDGFMIVLQEELDWQVYRIYGLLDKSDFQELDKGWIEKLPFVKLDERAFEIVLARKIKRGDIETRWFERHGSTPIVKIPTQWPKWYQDRVHQRIEWIETNSEAARRIRFLEQPEYKRRWNTSSWQEREKEALWNWMLDRIESPNYVPAADREDTHRLAINPEVVTMEQLYYTA